MAMTESHTNPAPVEVVLAAQLQDKVDALVHFIGTLDQDELVELTQELHEEAMYAETLGELRQLVEVFEMILDKKAVPHDG